MLTDTERPSRRAQKALDISFEFFPPKSADMEATLWDSIGRLAPLKPKFVSVTYGAGGSTRERTHATLARLRRETDLAPAAHLTCVGASRAEIDEVVDSYRDIGVRHIVALRGDPAGGIGTRFEAHPDGYETSTALVAGLARRGSFEITVSAYPERHPESGSLDADLDVLQAKIDAGATRAITQFFFDNTLFWRFLDRARARGITIPIVPGIVPVLNFTQTASFAKKAGASVPDWLARRFDGLDHDVATRRMVATAIASEQVFDLLDGGIAEFHFYTMNRAELVYAICHLLGLRPHNEAVAA